MDPQELYDSVKASSPHPYPLYRQLRESHPVFRSADGGVVLTRYAECSRALRHRSLGKRVAHPGAAPAPAPGRRPAIDPMWLRSNMLFSDPPEHTRLRRRVRLAFTSQDIDRLVDGVERRTAALVDEFVGRAGGDVMTALAYPLPTAVIEDALGIPETDRSAVAPLVAQVGAFLRPFAGAEALERASVARRELAAYLDGLAERARRAPGDDVISRLSAADDDEALDGDEMIAALVLLFAAGFETTACLIGNGVVSLLDNPDQLRILREDPDSVGRAVEEMLRYDPPAQFDRRHVLEPVEIAGVELSAGDFVTTLIGAANRDPARFEDPERFDVTRDPGQEGHLSFAVGPHVCLGAQLARMQARAVFTRLLARTRSMEHAGPVSYHPTVDLYGPTSLPVAVS